VGFDRPQAGVFTFASLFVLVHFYRRVGHFLTD
jgi:hypothetical protein